MPKIPTPKGVVKYGDLGRFGPTEKESRDAYFRPSIMPAPKERVFEHPSLRPIHLRCIRRNTFYILRLPTLYLWYTSHIPSVYAP